MPFAGGLQGCLEPASRSPPWQPGFYAGAWRPGRAGALGGVVLCQLAAQRPHPLRAHWAGILGVLPKRFQAVSLCPVPCGWNFNIGASVTLLLRLVLGVGWRERPSPHPPPVCSAVGGWTYLCRAE